MPLVIVTTPETRFPDATLRDIAELLIDRVARTLTCDDPGGQLAPSDIEVRFDTRSSLDLGGERYDFEVIVFANDFPSRRQNLDERCAVLRDALRARLTPDLHGYVWIRLAPAAFAEF